MFSALRIRSPESKLLCVLLIRLKDVSPHSLYTNVHHIRHSVTEGLESHRDDTLLYLVNCTQFPWSDTCDLKIRLASNCDIMQANRECVAMSRIKETDN